MFDVGFWEILFILLIALVIIGPERLPGAARKAGYFVGKARRYIEGVRSEVESELDINEFKRMLHNQEVQINELQQQLKTGVDEIKSDVPDNISVSELLADSPSHSNHDEQMSATDSVEPENVDAEDLDSAEAPGSAEGSDAKEARSSLIARQEKSKS